MLQPNPLPLEFRRPKYLAIPTADLAEDARRRVRVLVVETAAEGATQPDHDPVDNRSVERVEELVREVVDAELAVVNAALQGSKSLG